MINATFSKGAHESTMSPECPDSLELARQAQLNGNECTCSVHIVSKHFGTSGRLQSAE